MTRFLILLVLLAVLAGALFATAPNRDVVEQQIEENLIAQIDALEPADVQDEVTRLLLTTCKLGRSGCARLIRSLMDVQVENRWLYTVADLRLGQGEATRCYGLLNRVICPSL